MTYVANNTFTSLKTSRSAAAIPITDGNLVQPVDAVTEEQYARERLDSANRGLSNPPFLLTNTRNPVIEGGGRVVRGYIRRSDLDASDPTSKYRLYFMYNPEQITRNYMSYLDQAALDPYNTMYGTNNLTATPAILDFNFSLLFDRQLEVATDPTHPGTKVDFDFFDLVVRGVVPDVPNDGNAIPDNGIMMINPKNIAVIFGQDLAVHGRPYNASVSFTKFNNRMVPMRMQVDIVMKAFYIGPVSTIPDVNRFSSEQTFTATIPYDETVTYTVKQEDLQQPEIQLLSSTSEFQNAFLGGGGGVASGFPSIDAERVPGPGVLSPDQMADLVCGFLRGDRAAICIAIAYRESRFNSRALNINPSTRDHSVGLFQINQLAFNNKYGDDAALMDPLTSMRAFMSISSDGTNFKPWVVTPDGRATVRGYDLTYLSQAKALVRARNAY